MGLEIENILGWVDNPYKAWKQSSELKSSRLISSGSNKTFASSNIKFDDRIADLNNKYIIQKPNHTGWLYKQPIIEF